MQRYEKILNWPNYFQFIFNFNKKKTLLSQEMSFVMKWNLKKLNLLDKVIFVGTHGKQWSDFWTKDINPIVKKYNLKYLEVKGVKAWANTSEDDLKDLWNETKQDLVLSFDEKELTDDDIMNEVDGIIKAKE